jgi:alkylhydroperoxidase family enzyme
LTREGGTIARLEFISDVAADPTASAIFDRTVARAGDVPNLYRVLANSPAMLDAWVGFTWPLRDAPVVRRGLRELAILRVAQLSDAEYEYAHHLPMAHAHGVPPEQLEQLERWSESDEFDEEERAMLRFVDAVAAVDVDEETFAELARHFSPAAVIELLLTASFYGGVLPRVVQALQIELEVDYQTAGYERRHDS